MAFDPDDFETWERPAAQRSRRERLALYAAHGRAVMFLDYTTLARSRRRPSGSRALPRRSAGARAARRPFIVATPPRAGEVYSTQAVMAYLERRGLPRWAGTG